MFWRSPAWQGTLEWEEVISTEGLELALGPSAIAGVPCCEEDML